MSRLVDPGSSGAVGTDWADEPAEGTAAAVRSYVERVAKYVPAEIVAAYLTMNGFIGAAAAPRRAGLFLLSFGSCLALTPVYLARMADPGQPRALHLVVSTLAFAVWAYSLDGVFREFGLYDPIAASIALVLFTLVSGLFVPRPADVAQPV